MPAFLIPAILPTVVLGGSSLAFLSFGSVVDKSEGLAKEGTKLLLSGVALGVVAFVIKQRLK